MWGNNAVVTAALALMFLAPSFEVPSGQGIWRTECRREAASGYRDCEIIAEFQRSSPNQVMAVIYDVARERLLHVGHPAPSRVGLRVDGHQPIELYICTGQACLVRGKEMRLLLEQMRTGASLEIHLAADGAPMDAVTISLEGFEASYRRALGDFGHH